ncbi:MAG: hypothetical protein J0M17_02595, partial [Planctomycetes bacterium]|nr:hypothetical protein [Planctomycetota bacterium]
MAKWRIVAIEHFPELRLKINECRSILALWIELSSIYDRGLKGVDVDDLKRRIRKFGEWCVDAPQNSDARYDPFTSVVISLYEHRPEFQYLL